MKPKAWAALVGSLAVLGMALPAWAHHSFAAIYDTNQKITVHGG